MKVLASNKKAYFDFDVLDTVTAGINLLGWEVKSVKAGKISLAGAYIKNINNEMFLEGANIPMWKFASSSSKVDEKRRRKLLLTKRQIIVLAASAKQPGITIVPLEVIEDDRGLVKLNVALVKGRKKFDKRNVIKEKDIKRGIERDRKKYNI